MILGALSTHCKENGRNYAQLASIVVTTIAIIYEAERLRLSGLWLWPTFLVMTRLVFRILFVANDLSDLIWRMPVSRADTVSSKQACRQNQSAVDIIVTACGEDPEVLFDTITAVCNVDFPPDKFRIILADDGKDVRLHSMIKTLRRQYSNLFYYSRPEKRGFKAGNLNDSIAFADTLSGGSAEWIAVLDSDMVPERYWLQELWKRTTETCVAMVVSSQNFYNIPINDMLFQSTESQYALDEPWRDGFGGVWCNGSGFVVLRLALQSIGGIPESSIAEDTLCSLRLNAAGWRVVYVNQKLQWGLVPHSFEGHVEQRKRWAIGHAQNSLEMKFCLDRRLISQMNLHQRLQGFSQCIHPFCSSIFRPLALIVLPWTVYLVDFEHLAPNQDVLRSFVMLNILGRFTSCTKDAFDSQKLHLRAVRQQRSGTIWLAPILGSAVVYELATRFVKLPSVPFTSTGSMPGRLSERDKSACTKRIQRMKTLLSKKYLPLHLVVMNLVICLCFATQHRKAPYDFKTLAFLFDTISPSNEWDDLLYLVIPYAYMWSPPTISSRRERMNWEEKSRTWKSKESCKEIVSDVWAMCFVSVKYIGLVSVLATFFM